MIDPEVVFSIPVRINGKSVGTYDLHNLFSKWGNEDGDNGLLCDIAEKIIAKIMKLDYEVDMSWGIHNCAGVFSLTKNGKKVWVNEFALKELWNPDIYRKLWETLPEDVKKVLRELATTGIDLQL